MADANPYSAPGAALDTGTGAETYQPTIFSFNGRLGRMRYLAYGIGLMMVFMAIIGVLFAVLIPTMAGGGDGIGAAGFGFILLLYVPAIVFVVMFGKRRLNDLNRSGWWLLLMIVPIANLLLSIYLMFFPGTAGSNDFGPAPAPNSVAVLVIGWIVIIFFALSLIGSIVGPLMMGFAPQ